MVSIIVAVSKNGIIGAGGQMPWHIGEDLRMFRRVTTGHPVVMGRRTFESLGRPLPGRTNVVVTRNASWTADGVSTASSLEQALGMFPSTEEIFVIGGGEIYAQALPLAGRLYITHIDAEWEGDVRFPQWDATQWRLVSSEPHARGIDFPHPFEFRLYERKQFQLH
jgi:dihydrofolate reductase